MKVFKLITVAFFIATLSGCAGLFVAGAATTVQIVTDPRTTQEIWEDSNIELEVAGIGNKAPFTKDTRVSSNSYNGTVVLMGQASTDQLRREFESRVRELKGVKQVHNQIRVKPPLSISEISSDSWITTKVKSSLLADKELNGVKIKVITEDKEVFLLGYVSDQHADIAVEIARNISGVKQVIRAFHSED